jgi:branched-chain amino acid transport system substrate-binding protein
VFNVEGPIEPGPDTNLYAAVIEQYGDGLDPAGAGTVSFRSLMNLYVQLVDLGPDGVTADAIVEALRAQEDAPSFMGHPYTCDGEQLAGLPATCSPQQVLARIEDGALVQISDWIDVGQIYEG